MPIPTNFIDFSSILFWSQNVLIPPFLVLPTFTTLHQLLKLSNSLYTTFTNFYQLLPLSHQFLLPFTIFYHFLPTFTTFHQVLYRFYQLLSFFITFQQLLMPSTNFDQVLYSFTKFYHISPNLYYFSLIKNDSISFFFWFFFHLLTQTNPIMFLDAMLQGIILCLSLFYIIYGACNYYIK